MRLRDLIFVSVIVGGGLALARTSLGPVLFVSPSAKDVSPVAAAPEPIVAQVDAAFRDQWAKKRLHASSPAPELAQLRRLSLALCGTLPSLQEIRRFESRPAEGRIPGWVEDLLKDRRTADFLAERFARALVGTEDGPFIQFRRRRFTTWLSDALLANRPFDSIVRDLVADQGLWTDHPATNFVSVTFSEDTKTPDPERLAARVSRAFLGVRIDCAQCHDHPFQPWKQDDFRGLAAFFGGVGSSLRGIRDGEFTYKPVDRKTKEGVEVTPHVPFLPELLPAEGTPRARLASWLVNPANPNLARATVNRMWAIVFGRPLVEPVDDMPLSGGLPAALELLAGDFSAHGYNLHRLLRNMTALEVFRLDSMAGAPGEAEDLRDETWASFPITRMRPEQVAGSVFQAASLSTLGPNTPWMVRFVTYTGGNEFIRRYGDSGEDEFAPAGGTIPQRLLFMNGDLVQEKTGDGLFNASRRIAELAPTDEGAVDLAYLAVLTRRPTAEERAHFVAKLAGTKRQERKDRLTDLFWTLLNSTEFSWNH